MDKSKNILAVTFFFLFFLFSNAWASSEIDSCLSSINEEETNATQLDNNEMHTWDTPQDALEFNRSVVGAKFNTYGDFETNFNIDPDFPTSKQNTVLALYVGEPGESKNFIGCAKITMSPLGQDYEEDPSSISNDVYSNDNLDTFEHSTDNSGDYLYSEYTVDSTDTNGNDFVSWNVKRSFKNNADVYFNQGNIVDDYFSAVDDFKDGNEQAISNYRGDLCSMDDNWTNHLPFCDQYQESEVVTDIEDDTEPDYDYETPEPVTHQSPTNEQITTDFVLNDIIEAVNSHSDSLNNIGKNSGNQISEISEGGKIKASSFKDVKDALETNFETISKSGESDFTGFDISSGDKIERSDFDILISNINTYNEESMCESNDWSCGSWSRCSGGTTSRSVEKNRVCFSDKPTDSTTCQWELYQTGSTYREGGCSGTIYRDDTYRDTLGTSVSDLCGNYNHGQWMGHTKTVTKTVGYYDNCPSSN